jgi:NAD(P)-dependent dehydrogenase (short-subunit alcohol dehydrogenase family)
VSRVTADLTGRRVLVVGASAGIGRGIAQAAVRAGAEVAFGARRKDQLEAAVEETGDAGGSGRGVAVAGDVREDGGGAALVRAAADALAGPLDLVVYTAAMSPLALLGDMTFADWQAVFETNVVGAAMVARAAVDHLAPDGVIALMSSETAGRPRHGLVAYACSKMALEELIRGLRTEHPDTRFCRVAVGSTIGTEFGLRFDPDLMGRVAVQWIAHGEMRQRFMEPGELGGLILQSLAGALAHPGIDVQDMVFRPPGPILTDPGVMMGHFDEAVAAAGDG